MKFYKKKFKKWLQGNDIEMHSSHNEENSVVAEGFTRTLSNESILP